MFPHARWPLRPLIAVKSFIAFEISRDSKPYSVHVSLCLSCRPESLTCGFVRVYPSLTHVLCHRRESVLRVMSESQATESPTTPSAIAALRRSYHMLADWRGAGSNPAGGTI